MDSEAKTEVKEKVKGIICKKGKDIYTAMEEVNFFDAVYGNYSDEEYISIMKEVYLSYDFDSSLKKSQRKHFVDGMIFAKVIVNELKEKNLYDNSNIDSTIEYMNSRLLEMQQNDEIILDEDSEDYFIYGMISASIMEVYDDKPNKSDFNKIIRKRKK